MSNLPAQREPEPDEGVPWKQILGVAAAIYAVIFLILNDDDVEVSFVLFTARTSLFFLILLSMALGAALALLAPAWWRRRKRRSGDAGPT